MMKVNPSILDEEEAMNTSKNCSLVKPDNSFNSEFFSTVRYSRPLMMNQLRTFISKVENTPIEKYEIDLYNMTEVFVKSLFAKEIDIQCVERIHHILKVNQQRLDISSISEEKVTAKLNNILKLYPFITIQYDLFCNMIKFFNALLVKWNIAIFKNYDYRYSGRVLNVQMLDLFEINSEFFNIDVFWISSRIFTSPLNIIGSSRLIQMAKVLHDQIKRCISVFLYLNPKQFDQDYIIENNLAYKSKKFFSWAIDILPEKTLSQYKHTELTLVTGWAKCFKNSDPQIDYAFEVLQELEFSYRSFEKLLIGNILDLSGKDDF